MEMFRGISKAQIVLDAVVFIAVLIAIVYAVARS